MTYSAPSVPAVGDQITAFQADVVANNQITGLSMGTPVSNASSGTVTSGATETLDAVLGTYQFTAAAGRRYRATIDGLVINGSTTGDLWGVNIRNGGSSTPTASSTLVASSQVYTSAGGGPGQVSIPVAGTFVPGAGTVTLGVFVVRRLGSGAATPIVSSGARRELYASDFGQA